jgi:rSAM/selenodomain-associated transferase 2
VTPFDRLDVVIPTLNAAATLCQTLANLPPGARPIISDGGSNDGTIAIAKQAGCRIVTGPAGRGRQLSAAAAVARRPWYLFLHADTTISPGGWDAIADHMVDEARQGLAGSLRLRIMDDAWQARLIETGVAWRVRRFGLAYGDQGLLIHRDLYDAVSGYSDLPLMEDVEIMRRLGRSRHRVLDGEARTSARRWHRRGWVSQTALNLTCIILYRVGVPVVWIARLYGR